MTIPTNAKPIILRDYEAQSLASGRMGAIVRVVNPQPPNDTDIAGPEWYTPGYIDRNGDLQPASEDVFGIYSDDGEWGLKCHYLPGDTLWCREVWYYESHMEDLTAGEPDLPSGAYSHRYIFKADCHDYPVGVGVGAQGWNSPVTMPKEACRHILRVKSVKVCRAQDLTEERAVQCGFVNTFGFIQSPDNEYAAKPTTAKQKLLDAFFNHPAHKKMELDMYTPNWVWFVTVERSNQNDPN